MEDTVETLVERIRSQNYHCLNISHRKLTILPACLKTLRELRVALLNDNELVFPPEELMHLHNCLEELILDNNKFTLLPRTIAQFRKLKILSLSGICLGALTLEITELVGLRELWLNNCSLVSIPHEIKYLASLVKLGLKGNNLNTVPKSIGKLQELTWICLSENSLHELPPEFANLKQLRHADLKLNRFESIPPALISIDSLRVVLLSHNVIRAVSDDTLLAMANMVKVDLRNNPMTEQPKHWKGMDFIFVGSDPNKDSL